MTDTFKEIYVEGSLMPIYHIEPKQSSKGVVLVFHEAHGVDYHIKDVCSRLAEEGYEVFAPELFHRKGKHVILEHPDTIADMLSSIETRELIKDIQATLYFIKELTNTPINEIVTMGFCIGGYTSILASIHFPLLGSISFYGTGLVKNQESIGLTPLTEDLRHIKSPVLLFFGADDTSISFAHISIIDKKLDRAGIDYHIEIMKDSGHGFLFEHSKSFNMETSKEAWSITTMWVSQKFKSIGSTKHSLK